MDRRGTSPLRPQSPERLGNRTRQLMLAARHLVENGTDWATFYNRVLGPRGMIHRLFPEESELAAFQQTEAYRQIHQMLAELRVRADESASRKRKKYRVNETTRMITVRVPSSVHRALRDEADELGTSLNQLCVSKLLQWIDSQIIPRRSVERSEAEPIVPSDAEGAEEAGEPADYPWDPPRGSGPRRVAD